MGAAFDYAFRPLVGDAEEGLGGPCDDRPHRVELYAADADLGEPSPAWRPFALCPDHEAQLARQDARLASRGVSSRFRRPTASGGDATSAQDIRRKPMGS